MKRDKRKKGAKRGSSQPMFTADQSPNGAQSRAKQLVYSYLKERFSDCRVECSWAGPALEGARCIEVSLFGVEFSGDAFQFILETCDSVSGVAGIPLYPDIYFNDQAWP